MVKIAAEFDLVRLESLAGHCRRHFLFDGIEPLVYDRRIGGHDVLAAHHARADDIGGGSAEGRKYRRGGENVNLLDAKLRREARGMHRSGTAESIDDKFLRQVTCAYDLATN